MPCRLNVMENGASAEIAGVGNEGCSRGHVEVLDRTGLESRSGECHAVMKREYGRLLPAIVALAHVGPGFVR